MTKRSVVAVAVFTLITLGIYELYWLVKTKREMVARGAIIPTSWLVIVPFANIYWRWKWAEGVEYVTRGKSSAATIFLVVFLPGYLVMVLGPALAAAFIQAQLNAVTDHEEISVPVARVV